MYWRLIESAGFHPEAARADESTWAVFHGSPLAKYEAYVLLLSDGEVGSPFRARTLPPLDTYSGLRKNLIRQSQERH